MRNLSNNKMLEELKVSDWTLLSSKIINQEMFVDEKASSRTTISIYSMPLSSGQIMLKFITEHMYVNAGVGNRVFNISTTIQIVG